VRRENLQKPKWALKRKFDHGKLTEFKCRLCVAGWGLTQGIHFEDSWNGAPPWCDHRDLTCLAVLLGMSSHERDLAKAFCTAHMPDQPNGEKVIITAADLTQLRSHLGGATNQQCQMALYGHPVSGNAFSKQFVLKLLLESPIPLRQCPSQPNILVADFPPGHLLHEELFWIWINVDNLRGYDSSKGNVIWNEFNTWLEAEFVLTGDPSPLASQEPHDCLGVTHTYFEGGCRLDMPEYILKLISRSGITATPSNKLFPDGYSLDETDRPTEDELDTVVDRVNLIFHQQFTCYSEVVTFYSSILSAIGWIARQVCHILLLAHSLLGRATKNPGTQAFAGIYRVLRWLKGHTDVSLTYESTRTFDFRSGEWPVYSSSSDASFADDKANRRSQGGILGWWESQPPTAAVSCQSRRVCTSTMMSESLFCSMSCRNTVYKRVLFQYLGIPMTAPTVVHIDNQATAFKAGNRTSIRKFSNASKHFEVDHLYVVEAVQDGVVSVNLVPGKLPTNPKPTDGFPVDALTKPLSEKVTAFYHRALQSPIRG
jgi:hypothetical protein